MNTIAEKLRNSLPDAQQDVHPWVDPLPLPNSLPPVEPFNFDLLPVAFRDWAQDIAERMQCAPDFPAIGAMISLAGCVNRRCGIRPKRHDDWLVVPNLWGYVVGRPGVMKSPAMEESKRPLARLEADAEKRWKGATKEQEIVSVVAEIERDAKKKKLKKAVEEGKDAREAAEEYLKQQESKTPIRERYLTSEPSPEAVGALLNENPFGLTLYRDELVGFLKTLDKEGHENARAFYLECWNGKGTYFIDRIGRGNVKVEATCLCIFGCIQPGPLGDYIRSAARDGAGADGLIQRFQLAVWPDLSTSWQRVDRWPDLEAKNRAYEVFQRLADFDHVAAGASRENPDDPSDVPYLRFDDDAQELFFAWWEDLELKLRAVDNDEHPVMESHLSKYRSLIPSLALLCHLADVGKGPVGKTSLERAIRWGEYLESHARRIYADAIDPAPAAAQALAHKIEDGRLPDGFALKDVYRPGWSRLRTSEDAAMAVDVLISLGWLRTTVSKTEGAPKTEHWINPKILAASRTAKTAKSLSSAAYGGNGSDEEQGVNGFDPDAPEL